MGKILLVVFLLHGKQTGTGAATIDIVFNDKNQCEVVGAAIMEKHRQKFAGRNSTFSERLAVSNSYYTCIEVPGVLD